MLDKIPEELRTCWYEINTEEMCNEPSAYIFSWHCGEHCKGAHYVASCAKHRELVVAHIRAERFITQALPVN